MGQAVQLSLSLFHLCDPSIHGWSETMGDLDVQRKEQLCLRTAAPERFRETLVMLMTSACLLVGYRGLENDDS